MSNSTPVLIQKVLLIARIGDLPFHIVGWGSPNLTQVVSSRNVFDEICDKATKVTTSEAEIDFVFLQSCSIQTYLLTSLILTARRSDQG